MICQYCGNEMFIEGSRVEVRGDTSPEEETVVERVLQFVCRNPKCGHSQQGAQMRVRLNG